MKFDGVLSDLMDGHVAAVFFWEGLVKNVMIQRRQECPTRKCGEWRHSGLTGGMRQKPDHKQETFIFASCRAAVRPYPQIP